MGFPTDFKRVYAHVRAVALNRIADSGDDRSPGRVDEDTITLTANVSTRVHYRALSCD